MTFNGKNSQPRKRSTNSRALSTRTHRSPVNVAMMATGTNPSLSLGKAPSNPPPVPTYGDKWVKRVYSCFKNATTSTGTAVFTQADFGAPGRFFVDKFQVWRLGFDTTAEPGLRARFKQGAFTDLGADDVVSDDYGSGTSLPGVTCKVPLGHAVGVANTGTTSLVEVAPVVSATTSANACYVVHMTCWVSV